MSRKPHTLSWRLTRPIRLRISLGFREVELLFHHPVRYKAIAQSFLMQIAVGNISTHDYLVVVMKKNTGALCARILMSYPRHFQRHS